MQAPTLISINDFCVHYRVEVTFVETLAYNGLIETTTIEQAVYIQPEQLTRLEKFVRLHKDLAIHADDLDVVSDLLDRLENLQQTVTTLQNRLVFYESL